MAYKTEDQNIIALNISSESLKVRDCITPSCTRLKIKLERNQANTLISKV